MAVLAAGVLTAACDVSPTDIVPNRDVEPVGRPTAVRGIYVSAIAAGTESRLAALLELAATTDVNTFVIDVKDHGEVSHASDVPLVEAVGASRGYIADLGGLLETLRKRGIYPIARIAVFRDPLLAEARPGWAIHTKGDGPWLDPEDGRPWVDPYREAVWRYNIDLAREALTAGFAEIQWDYVRFPDVPDSVSATWVLPERGGRTPDEVIRDFLDTSRRELAAFRAPVTADVFGRVVTATDGSGIGQHWDELVRVTDVVLPMIYPALYWPGNFGVPEPEAEPYGLVRAALEHARERLARTQGARATIRPWLQAFTLGSATYGADEMAAQIKAVEDAGLDEWLFWNPASEYPAAAFRDVP